MKRCFVEPFCEKFLKINSVSVAAGAQGNPLMSEIARFKDTPAVFETLNQTLGDLEQHNLMSEALMFDLKPSLKSYIELIEILKEAPAQGGVGLKIAETVMAQLRILLSKCNFADCTEIDHNNKV